MVNNNQTRSPLKTALHANASQPKFQYPVNKNMVPL